VRHRTDPPLTDAGALLCDRDGTLVVDVPYNGDPERVQPLPGAREALERARAAGLKVAVVSNQRGVARGLVAPDRLVAVNRRVAELLGPFDAFECCPHDVIDRCRCRKPAPGLVLRAAARLRLPASACAVIGDRWSDVLAARNAGATAILLGDGSVRPPGDPVVVCVDLSAAVDAVLAGCRVP
jgi:D-glycero-D-manno-heptose 1,7-bisphosphate phosphatase